MKLSARPIVNPAAVFQRATDGRAVLVNLDTADSLALNPTGIVVWQLVDGRTQMLASSAREGTTLGPRRAVAGETAPTW